MARPAAEVAVHPRARLRPQGAACLGMTLRPGPAGLPVPARAVQPARSRSSRPGARGDHPAELPGRVAGLGDGRLEAGCRRGRSSRLRWRRRGCSTGRHLARDPGRKLAIGRGGLPRRSPISPSPGSRVRPGDAGRGRCRRLRGGAGGRRLRRAPRHGLGRPPIPPLPLGLLGDLLVLGNLMLLKDPIVRPFLSAELHFNYTQCVFIADVLPSTFSLATTPRLGAWLDRTNPLIAWSLIRPRLGHRPAAARPVVDPLAGGRRGRSPRRSARLIRGGA